MRKVAILLALLVLSTMVFGFGDGTKRAGVHLNYGGGDLELGFGGRFEMDLDEFLPVQDLVFAGNYNYFLCNDPEGFDLTAYQFSFDLLNMEMPTTGNFKFYYGTGICFDFVKVKSKGPWKEKASANETGIELILGGRYKIENLLGYTEIKTSLGGFEKIILTTGILF